MLGFFTNYKRCPVIHTNHNLEYQLQRFTCAHEFGHYILHPKVNVPFLRKTISNP
ncbi:MAG: ImmA/IrrE family metallo-endopeptidase [Candidatus Pristimantibacillus lignocellulolyticus]|uniref:ImmA/IrrE family metallo-endopeptidase n=1 Tax=Candidatus Pristimantibacillus lignocellulolyticus TaxID=2994561 RepID=A0A9J6ZA09_9BACL|nr:MAG: ImmA/IrrE family metallo-endopeptidase [Candidatus Pristimantibacillus lignocellulolyticus]